MNTEIPHNILSIIPTEDGETFVAVNGYPFYYISDRGRVWSVRRKRFIAANGNVTLSSHSYQVNKSASHLILEHFGKEKFDDYQHMRKLKRN